MEGTNYSIEQLGTLTDHCTTSAYEIVMLLGVRIVTRDSAGRGAWVANTLRFPSI